MKKRIFAFILCLPLTACFTSRFEAPPETSVRIMAADEPAEFCTEHKDWYLFWGILPIWRTGADEVIAREKLVEARVSTQDRVSDTLIIIGTDLLTGFLPIFPQTIVVEGNRTPHQPGNIPKMPGTQGKERQNKCSS